MYRTLLVIYFRVLTDAAPLKRSQHDLIFVLPSHFRVLTDAAPLKHWRATPVRAALFYFRVLTDAAPLKLDLPETIVIECPTSASSPTRPH